MRIAVDISPINKESKSAHKVRGVGKYISLLGDNLEKFDSNNEYIFSSNPEKEKVDLIHYPYFDPFFITFPLIKRTKTVITVHDLIPIAHRNNFPSGLRGGFSWQINKIILKNSDKIITDSEASKKAVQKLVGINERKITSIHLGISSKFQKKDINKAKKENLLKKYGIPENFFLYVGDVTWNKNLPRLCDAVIYSNVPLVMVGKALMDENFDRKNPWNYDRLAVYKKTQDKNLFFKLGYVSDEDLVDLYNLAVGLVTPSIDEGFGLPALEAMQSGCPVISSRLGSLPEVCGDAAFYIEANNTVDISSAISKLWANQKLRQELREKGLSQSKKFSIKKMIEGLVSVYESTI